jgi:hypothetical protein
MQALEWALLGGIGEYVQSAVAIGCGAAHGAWQIGTYVYVVQIVLIMYVCVYIGALTYEYTYLGVCALTNRHEYIHYSQQPSAKLKDKLSM